MGLEEGQESSTHVWYVLSCKEMVYCFIVSQDKENIIDFPMYLVVFRPWIEASKDDEGNAIYGFYDMYPTDFQNNPCAMNEWEQLYYPWYMEVEGWTTPFDQNKKVGYQKN